MAKVSKKKANKRSSKAEKKRLMEEEEVRGAGGEEEEVRGAGGEEEEVKGAGGEEEEEEVNGAGGEEEEEEVKGAGGAVSSEEEEDGEDDRKRRRLLEAIMALGGKRKKTLGERSEAAALMSEFTVTAEGEAERVELSDLVGAAGGAPAVPAQSRKQLRSLQRSQRTEECPLSSQQRERIQRDLAFQKTAARVSRWDAVITQNQRAEQLVFPLDREPSGPRPMERVVVGWGAQTPLEREVFALLSAHKQPLHDPVLTPAEEASVRAMSLEEARVRRAELQKARALQSYHEAKARREAKIKSKKYHRVHNKARRRELLRQFERQVREEPGAALEALQGAELRRMQERMSLKHQNSSRWAKSRAIVAKYDLGARRAMQQQLELNRELTQRAGGDPGEEQEEAQEEPEVLPDFVNDAEPGPDPSNPWMRGKLSEEQAKGGGGQEEAQEEEEKRVEEEEEEEEEDVMEEGEQALLTEFDRKRKLRQEEEEAQEEEEEAQEREGGAQEEEEEAAAVQNVIEEEEEEQEEEQEEEEEEEPPASESTPAQGSLRPPPLPEEAPPLLEEGLLRTRTFEDLDLLAQDPGPAPDRSGSPPDPPAGLPPPPVTGSKRKRSIELRKVLTKACPVIGGAPAPTVEDSEDPRDPPDQRGLIREAFAGDDVVSDFLTDKRRQEQAGGAKVVDLSLPGWGEWGGLGLKPSARKRRRFRVRGAAPPPRRDQQLPSVIISEKRGGSVAPHQVSALPFPFQTQAQFQGCMRAPLGRTWNTERTLKRATRPRVLTQLGAIIQPMAPEQLEAAGGGGEKPGPRKDGGHKGRGPQKAGAGAGGHKGRGPQKAGAGAGGPKGRGPQKPGL